MLEAMWADFGIREGRFRKPGDRLFFRNIAGRFGEPWEVDFTCRMCRFGNPWVLVSEAVGGSTFQSCGSMLEVLGGVEHGSRVN